MADKISDNLIDEILSDIKTRGREDSSVEEYSLVDVDLLLAELTGEKPENKDEEIVFVKPEIKEEKEPPKKNSFTFDLSKIQDFDDDDEIPELVVEKEEEKIPEFVIEEAEEEKESDDVAVSVEGDGQLGFTSEIEDIIVEEEKEESAEEVESVTGQISIEKTRMFNEIDVRSAYNPNISHNLGNKVVRTTSGDAQPLTSSSVMDEEKYRRHFFNKPVQKLESTMEQRAIRDARPPETIETPGFIVKNGEANQNTDGIRSMPTIIGAEYELEQEKTKEDFGTKVVASEKPDNQIRLDGFDDDEDIIQQPEEEAEAELRENRKAAVKEFVAGGLSFKEKVQSPPVRRRYERQKVSVVREYFGPKDKQAVKKVFEMEKKSLFIKLIAVSVICLLMSILSMIAGMENGNFEIYGNNEVVYALVQIILLLVACGLNYNSFITAFNNIKSKIFDMDTVVSVSAIAGFIQCVFAFIFADSVESVARITAGAAVLPMIMKLAGELVRCKNDSENFKVITEDIDECYSVQNIADEDTANEISRGLMMGNPEIKYSVPIDFPQKFVEISRSSEVTGKICKLTIPAMAIVGLVLGIIAAIKTGNFFVCISTLASTLLMTLPCSAGLVSAINLRATNKLLNEDGAMINGYCAVDDAVNTNGVVIDACDAFEQGGCNIEGMKTYHKMRIDEAILYTASVVIASGGVLAEVFDGVIIGKRELLLPVESLAYEEKLGCSCWIHNHRVLVGNRDLLVHHNVETPDKDLEDKYKSNGRNVIYLAIEGKIAAMFVVVYKANEETARYMRELEKDGITIFFRTSDANITERFLEREFQLPANVVKIINPVAGDMFTRVRSKYTERSNAMIIHDGGIKTMLSALHGTFVINNFVNSSRLIHLIASVIGAVIMALFTFLSGIAQIGVLQIILYQVIWTVILSVPALTRKK